MYSLGHFIASLRRFSAALAATLALAMLAAGPAQAASSDGAKAKPIKIGKKMVGASDVKSVIAYLASKGDTVAPDDSESGDPVLTESNNYYQVYFSCDEDHTTCQGLEFRACYADYPAAKDKTNGFSRDYFYAKGYIDSSGNACIEIPVTTGLKGISYEAMDVAYTEFMAFTGSSDEYFGSAPPQ